MKRPWTFGLALLLSLLLPPAALARDPGGVFQVSADRFGSFSPSAAMDDDGGFLVSWVSGGSGITARRYDPAGAPLAGQTGISTWPRTRKGARSSWG